MKKLLVPARPKKFAFTAATFETLLKKYYETLFNGDNKAPAIKAAKN